MGTTLPSAQNYIIKRPRLTKLLDQSTARIILLCAPAGYGKTTLAREWVATRTEPVAWYRGGIEMLDSAAVARGVLDALVELGTPEEHAIRLRALVSQGPGSHLLGRALATATTGGAGAVLVLDDYHNAEPSADSQALIETFVLETHIRVLLTSRVRPRWLTPRMRVYGEAVYVGGDDLAFTDAEAHAVLAAEHATREAEGLVSRARGWPVVIGLAARRQGAGLLSGESLVPAELYEYFVEDLFRATPEDLRTSLFRVALAGDVNKDVVRGLLFENYEAHLAEASLRGFVAPGSTDEFELHPLLRAFLLERLHELPTVDSQPLITDTLRSLAAAKQWDPCLAVLTEYPQPELATTLLEEALPDLLESGRLSSVKRWVAAAFDEHEHAVVLLAEAELALREGFEVRAQARAERAASLALNDDVVSHAHLVAARAAHLRGDDGATRRNARLAASIGAREDVHFSARWVEFLSAFEVQDPSVRDLFQNLKRAGSASPEQALRLIQARLFLALEVDCQVRTAAGHAEHGHELLRSVADPLARSSFLNISSSTMVYLGSYDRALQLADEQIDDAHSTGLDFSADHAAITRAGALAGLRKIAAAHRVLQELEARGDSISEFVRGQIQMKRSRIKVATGDIEHAEILVRSEAPQGLPPAFYGEWFGLHAVYLAALGDIDGSRRASDEARRRSTYIDARHFTNLAAVITGIVARDDDPRARQDAIDTIERLIAAGHVDGVILACRAFPRLASVAASDAGVAIKLTSVLANSRDVDLARAAGLSMPRELRRSDGLTKRERDVYELLVQGRKNREIAQALFISESTTKVHIRHIYEKLGVHSRAEAAAAAVREHNSKRETQ